MGGGWWLGVVGGGGWWWVVVGGGGWWWVVVGGGGVVESPVNACFGSTALVCYLASCKASCKRHKAQAHELNLVSWFSLPACSQASLGCFCAAEQVAMGQATSSAVMQAAGLEVQLRVSERLRANLLPKLAQEAWRVCLEQFLRPSRPLPARQLEQIRWRRWERTCLTTRLDCQVGPSPAQVKFSNVL